MPKPDRKNPGQRSRTQRRSSKVVKKRSWLEGKGIAPRDQPHGPDEEFCEDCNRYEKPGYHRY